MANYCYNWVEFTGSKNTLQKLKNKFKLYEKFDKSIGVTSMVQDGGKCIWKQMTMIALQ